MIPDDCTEVWTRATDTGELLRWVPVPMAPDSPLRAYGRLWCLTGYIGAGRYTDAELLARFGAVYTAREQAGGKPPTSPGYREEWRP